MDYALRASSSSSSSRSSFGASFYPRGGSIGGSVKFQGPRSLQMLGLGPVSGATVHVTNSHGHTAKEPAGNGSEGLENGGNDPLDLIRGRSSKEPWWAPIFKFSKSHDLQSDDDGGMATATEGDGKAGRATVFTDEKARVLRRELRATESWHDLMYHSAIASRMAVPDEDSL